jgi:hypothetical protein
MQVVVGAKPGILRRSALWSMKKRSMKKWKRERFLSLVALVIWMMGHRREWRRGILQ